MRANRKTDTRPEVRLRSGLHRAGIRFRKHRPIDFAGGRVRPDVVLPRARIAVFVDGCFWHACPEHGTEPTHNSSYWSAKLARNQQRDDLVNRGLRSAGWTVIRVWEHVPTADAVDRVLSAVRLQGG
jgi:DNA mismatch endonuclease, patch repair protein